MAGKNRRHSAEDAPRRRVANLELHPRSPVSPTDTRTTPHTDLDGAPSPAFPRSPLRTSLSPDGPGPASGEVDDGNGASGSSSRQPHAARPRTTDLYTIESHTPASLAIPDPRRPSRPDGPSTTPRRSRIEESRVSLTLPRQTFDEYRDIKIPTPAAEKNDLTLAHSLGWATLFGERQRRPDNRPWARIRSRADKAYKRYVVEGLLRQKPLPPSQDGRHIPLKPGLARRKPLKDERTGHAHVSNFIRSCRYTVWNFLPKQIFFQFSKLANFYFLVIGVVQMIPGLSTTGTYTTIGPLMAFVALSMAKEGYDDYRRYRLDKLENRSPACVLDPEGTVTKVPRGEGRGPRALFRRREKPTSADADVQVTEVDPVQVGNGESGQWATVEWQDIRVGDIIKLRRDDNVPADIILLHATGPNGVAFIETMALDGETNLKSKQASPLLAKHCASVAAMGECDAEIVTEDPNLDLYNFEGRATVNGEAMPLTLNEVVYRGSTLRNTTEAIGLVINSGEECKIRMNANKNVRAKAPELQYAVNRIVVMLVFFVIILSVGCTVGYIMWRRRYESHAWYLRRGSVSLGQIFVAFVIAYNTLIPLSLYVSLEIVKLGQLYLLSDIEMYDPVTDTPMVANTTTILENLGQVSYVFSDKTGTLTENMMKFRKISVAGSAWLHDMDLQTEAEKNGKYPAGQTEKGHHQATTPRPSVSTRLDPGIMEETIMEGRLSESGARLPRTSTASRWKSSVHPPPRVPENKTEDLLGYLSLKPHSAFSRKARQLILCLALCHTCLPETSDDGQISFQAASPDELALVEAAKDLGCLLVDRSAQSMTLQSVAANGAAITETYQILDVIEFSSKRKRMSIIIRMPDGRLCIFTKGADSVILPRLRHKQLAIQTASAVERRASMRRSVEQEKALRRQSLQNTKRDSLNFRRPLDRKDGWRRSFAIADEVDHWLARREADGTEEQTPEGYQTPRRSMAGARSLELARLAEPYDGMVDESMAVNEGAVFERCFQHVDDFASEGLRTLIFAYRYLDEDEYRKWKTVYLQATTSLVKRQERIEDAAEQIEQDFDLAGATAIEDKLQQGVPETIDKLRRANIKVWMLTGDKRETAINIAHSARICKPFSEVYILDATQGELRERLAMTLTDVCRGMVPHSVAVVDGHTLSIIEDDDTLRVLFYDLVARVDSVICCRASPSQKAGLVKAVRHQTPAAVTLAIGDGANDIAMIQSSHVGIGISGREGLQAARIADYSIAQFRFLQRLLFVHGRWNYARSGRYILGTFWKEVVFYLLQAHYQRFNGYTGTSLFESTALTVFNTIFTSLPVIIPGIFERDLSASTLLAFPELYSFGQRNRGFNFLQYLGWMAMAVTESVIIYYAVYYIYAAQSHWPVPTDLYPFGTLVFSLAVVFINLKLMFIEVHDRTPVILAALGISLLGWWLWGVLLSVLFKRSLGPYVVRGSFVRGFGRQGMWWLVHVVVLSALVVFEVLVEAVRRGVWPTDADLMREMEGLVGRGGRGVMREDVVGGDGGETGVVEGVMVADGRKSMAMGGGEVASLETVTSASLSAGGGVAVPASVPLPTSPGLTVPGWQRWEGAPSGGRLTGEFARRPFTPPAEEEYPMESLDATARGGK